MINQKLKRISSQLFKLKITRTRVGFLVLFSLSIVLAWGLSLWLQTTPETGPAVASAEKLAVIKEPILPLPLKLELDEQKVDLGNQLFHDPLLSSNGTISCASCHDLKKAGTDRLVVSKGMDGHLAPINSPTVFNSGFNSRQFWDGRADTLEDQIDGPMSALGEMGGLTWQEVIDRLNQEPHYKKAFKQIYSDTITELNVKDAIATFEKSL